MQTENLTTEQVTTRPSIVARWRSRVAGTLAILVALGSVLLVIAVLIQATR